MLKSAKEIQQVSEEARRKTLEKALLLKKDEEQRRRELEALEKDRIEFQSRAIQAAKVGNYSLDLTDLDLGVDHLKGLGFDVHQFTRRRDQYESWLFEESSAKQQELSRYVDAMLSACPSFRFIKDSDIQHRNPLMSLLQGLCPREEAVPVGLEGLFLRSLSSMPDIDKKWVAENNAKVKACSTLFSEMKLLQSKHKEVAWENRQLPADASSCLRVSWDDAQSCIGPINAFDASLVRWFADHWEQVSVNLACLIEQGAKDELNFADVQMYFNGECWELLNTEDDGIAGINPQILGSELSKMGYSTEIFRTTWETDATLLQVSDEELKSLAFEPKTLSDEEEPLYVLRVRWDS